MSIAFDLYGTLVDIRTDEESPRFRKKFTRFLKKSGRECEFFLRYREEIKKHEEEEIDLVLVFEAVLNCSAEEARNIMKAYRRFSRRKLRLYPHVRSMLTELKRRGAKVYLISNAQNAFTMDELVALKIKPFFDGIALSSDYAVKKPSAVFFQRAMDCFSVTANETVYVGNDVACDMIGSSSVGMRSVYIRTNISPQEDTVLRACEIAEYGTNRHKKLKAYLLKMLSV